MVKNVINLNTDTVITRAPPIEMLPDRSSPEVAIPNVYELQTVVEHICYYHTCCGFQTKTGVDKSSKKELFASWLGLTVKAVQQKFPELGETQNGHM